jgi:SAM-dependent methyltransferase
VDDATTINRGNWDVWAAAHGQDAYYDSAGLVAGADSLTEVERAGLAAAVRGLTMDGGPSEDLTMDGGPSEDLTRDGGPGEDLTGLDILHVQCHLGFDAISLARRGARVTGADFSPVALGKARDLARRCAADVAFVEADATDLPATLHGRFDLAYATMGILCWIEDPARWMRSVAATLRPGGRLLLVDGHPLWTMVATADPFALDFPYAFDGPHRFEGSGSYATAAPPTTHVEYAHSLGEIVTAAATADLRVLRLEEHLESPLDLGRGLLPDPDGRYRFEVSGQRLPLLYTLIAERPGG